jgi:hypothetical protein
MFLTFALLMAAQAADAPSAAAATADCSSHMVEIPVMVTSKGLPKQSKVKICGTLGQTDAEWAGTLRDALSKVELDSRMSAAVKDQIVSGLKIEIAKLPSAGATRTPAPRAQIAPPPQASIVPPSAAASDLAKPSVDTGRVEYSALPPMPAPLPPAAAAVVAANAPPPPPPLPAPKLSLRCLSTNTVGSEGPCDALERDTVVTVKADEDLPNGTSLRFMRRGDNRAEVDLAPLRRGQSQRFALPARVCQGVNGSRVEIQVIRATLRAPQVVDTRGPFELTC